MCLCFFCVCVCQSEYVILLPLIGFDYTCSLFYIQLSTQLACVGGQTAHELNSQVSWLLILIRQFDIFVFAFFCILLYTCISHIIIIDYYNINRDLTLELPFTLTHPKPKHRVISQMVNFPPRSSLSSVSDTSKTGGDSKEAESADSQQQPTTQQLLGAGKLKPVHKYYNRIMVFSVKGEG